MCGENVLPFHLSPSEAGSPPRVRGKLQALEPHAGLVRLTPACAGKTPAAPPTRAHAPAHPRVCGENTVPFGTAPCHVGSPPRVRGKQHGRDRLRRAVGLTPACAGKTPTPRRTRWPSRAHPRVCGENWYRSMRPALYAGSPPRVRGKQGVLSSVQRVTRLTPACAGKTVARLYEPDQGGAHPRVCGENFPNHRASSVLYGSPPRVRGKPGPPMVGGVARGLTPACAGKTRTPILADCA
mgnify:CR=1 FL=1